MRQRRYAMMHLRLSQWVGVAAALLLATAGWVAAGEPAAPNSVAKPAPQASAPMAARASAPKSDTSLPSRPLWLELTPAQQLALQPLHGHWNGLSDAQKRKWLVLSKNYPNMASAEQAKLQARMTEWVALSAQQRTQARLNYVQAKAISPTEKQEKWQAYQALSPEEKNKLARTQPPAKGAAPVVKPDAAAQLTRVPTSPKSVKPGQKIATATHKIDQKTLLPQPEKAAAMASPASEPAPALMPAAAAAPGPGSTD